jgi:FlaA1/EpsC-like NDP-sugar epimerase
VTGPPRSIWSRNSGTTLPLLPRTISEAVGLVWRAERWPSTVRSSSLGEPVRIADLARQLIFLSGRSETEVPILQRLARRGRGRRCLPALLSAQRAFGDGPFLLPGARPGHPEAQKAPARKMIALAGLSPGDVEIAFTGLRPGEKLYEELSHDVEVVTATPHPKIARLVSPERRMNGADFVDRLRSACEAGNLDPQEFKLLLARFLPEYTPAQTEPLRRA